MSVYAKNKAQFEAQGNIVQFDQAIKDGCDMIMRQTDYDYDTSFAKLIEHDLDISKIVRAWMGTPNVHPVLRSTNQKMFDEFRYFLDDAALEYQHKKELEHKAHMTP